MTGNVQQVIGKVASVVVEVFYGRRASSDGSNSVVMATKKLKEPVRFVTITELFKCKDDGRSKSPNVALANNGIDDEAIWK